MTASEAARTGSQTPPPAVEPHAHGGQPGVGAHAQSGPAELSWTAWALLVLGACVWTVAWYGTTFASMLHVWRNSETFAHGIVVYPLAAWLVWRERARLAALRPRPCPWALVPLAGAGLAWLIAHAGGVQAGMHVSAVAVLALLPWVVLGTRVARILAFALAFTVFAAPIGDFLLPVLMEHTADFTVAALRLTGMPVYREGLQFMVPSGSWSVVEACSGLRYLIASVMLGCLYAYLTYRSFWRRAVFVVISAVLPIFANWIRAYLIVMIGHLSDMRLAVGVDHLIYGWLFFGFVMLLLFWIGARWREDIEPGPSTTAAPVTGPGGSPGAGLAITLAAAALTAFWPAQAERFDEAMDGPQPALTLTLPASIGPWQTAAAPSIPLHPHFSGMRARTAGVFTRGSESVGLFIGYYFAQRDGSELINYHNAVVAPLDSKWSKVWERRVDAGAGLQAIETRVRGPSGVVLVRHLYWVAGRWTARAEEVKVLQAWARLTGQGDDAAVVLVQTAGGSDTRDLADARLSGFLESAAPAIEGMLRSARQARRSTPPSAQSAGSPAPTVR